MTIESIRVRGYRSVMDVRLELGRVNVLVGPNGCGKTNLYRAMLLMAEAARGGLSRVFASEGGFPSALSAGHPKQKGPRQVSVEARIDELEYGLTCGLPAPGDWYKIGAQKFATAFGLDPAVKSEQVQVYADGRAVTMLERRGAHAWTRDASGGRVEFPVALDRSETAVAQLRDPERFPVLFRLREALFSWRFYHGFRTDLDAPLRQPQFGVFTPVLSDDGVDLAAALQTIFEQNEGAHDFLQEAISRVIPGARLVVEVDRGRALFELRVEIRGALKRHLGARELSDGTLRFICLLAALLSPRPPDLLALNEPETSLHPDLIDPLADLIVDAASRSQIWLTTHSRELADRIAEQTGESSIELDMVDGETIVRGRDFLGGRRLD